MAASFAALAHQPADCDEIARRMSRGNLVARRKRGKLQVAADEEPVGGYEESIRALARKGAKGRIDLADRSGFEYLDLQADSAGSFLNVPQCGLGVCSISGVDYHSYASGLGHQFMQKSQPFCHHLPGEKVDAGRVATRPGEAGDKTKLDWVFIDSEHDWDRCGCSFGRDRISVVAGVTITATRRRTRSAISPGRRSNWPSSRWYSTVTFLPSR
jgi:hypothetical protein